MISSLLLLPLTLGMYMLKVEGEGSECPLLRFFLFFSNENKLNS